MANDLNQCNFIGRLGRDPELKVIGTGNSVCNFTIACGWKTKEKEGTEWVNVVAWGKLAEICGQYLHKGSKVFISGKQVTRSWDKNGEKRYVTEIVASEMQMLDSKGAGSGADANQQRAPSKQQSAPATMPDNDFDDAGTIPW